MTNIPSSEITPEHIYRSRRDFMKGVGAVLLGSAALAGCGQTGTVQAPTPSGPPPKTVGGATTDELGDTINSYEQITNYNNYYEFTTDKEGVALMAQDFSASPWTLEVGGLVNKPQKFAIEDLTKLFGEEERIYRLRCVEGWSMVIPWLGFPLQKLLTHVEPTAAAKYVRFEAIHAPEKLPGQRDGFYNWPYIEGLRLDEAMNDLTLLGTGLYGRSLPPQNGAPIRLHVPWKYGFKSIKAIVKIDLVAEQPTSLWMAAAPREYGFYANVNPDVPHPRWSQSSERRIGETGRRPTLAFNGYAEQVASLYAGMDLRANY
jgi:sulfoxide reductase catalytic subunit YedY